jgi:hypothetical protein
MYAAIRFKIAIAKTTCSYNSLHQHQRRSAQHNPRHSVHNRKYFFQLHSAPSIPRCNLHLVPFATAYLGGAEIVIGQVDVLDPDKLTLLRDKMKPG